jgi:L-Ala-D/L-Glu epimerase / N-acetyl-D-glutamate racemase
MSGSLSPPLTCHAAPQRWPLAQPFVIARGSKTEAATVQVTVSDGVRTGLGECVPYSRYHETVAGVVRQIEAWQPTPERDRLHAGMPAGAARNAIDCALWDLECKVLQKTIADRLGPRRALTPLPTAYTLSLDAPDAMAAVAAKRSDLSFFKLKLGGDGFDGARMAAVRKARPDARLVADANEAWRPQDVGALLQQAGQLGFEMIEQPLPQGADDLLAGLPHDVAICADESVHVCDDLPALAGRYDAVNIKLDKAGGLTEALVMKSKAQALGLKVMIGSMVSSSLAIAPAFVLAQDADWVDLDSPLLLAADRDNGFRICNGIIQPADAGLWGDAV